MSVKAIVDYSQPLKKARKYPYLGVLSTPDDGDLVVLFDTVNAGTVVKSCTRGFSLGTYVTSWKEAQFAVLQLPLIMENE